MGISFFTKSFQLMLLAIACHCLLSPQSLSAAEPAKTEPPAKPNTLSAAELRDGWLLLFDGAAASAAEPLPYGWQTVGAAKWEVRDGEIRTAGEAAGFLATTSEFADYELQADFRAAKDANSGIFLRTPLEPKNPAADCYELNIAAPEVSPFPTGSLVQRKKCDPIPVADENWHTFHVSQKQGRTSVSVDGKAVLDDTDPQPLGRGRIALQSNKGAVAFRNLKLKPLSTATIFNGRNLGQWTVFPGKMSEFAVTPAAELAVKNGPGMLESRGQYGDFVLQWEVRTNGKQLNSGVFFRQIPGEFTQGYECQIHNGYKNDDRAQPVDCGTGGFYRRQNARLVNGNDFEWTAVTLIVSGPHMATWVNGVQVSDWTDTRKPDDNARKGLRTAKGTLSLQGHDPTTDILFRDLRIVELTPR